MAIYGKEFYAAEGKNALSAAEIILPFILNRINCSSIVDFGCGTGEWLKIGKKWGSISRSVLGLDGEYVSEYLVIDKDEFMAVDLTSDIQLDRRFDLAISLEVAEHLPEDSAKVFIHNITRHADVVLFSAALPHQGGTLHLNEQYPSYWRRIFGEFGYELCDCIRKEFWNDNRIEWFYRQNMFLYCKRELADDMRKCFPCENKILDVIHPQLFEYAYYEKYIFPFNKVRYGSKVIIYAAGLVGRAFVNQLMSTNYAELIMWCDSEYKRYIETDMPIKNPDRIVDCKYDYIVVAVKSESAADKIKERLFKMNVPIEKIIWRSPNMVRTY